MEAQELLKETITLYSKFLNAYRDNAVTFIEDAKENGPNLEIAGSLIDSKHAALDRQKFNKLSALCHKKSLSEAEVLIRNLSAFVSRTANGDMYRLGGMVFRSGRSYLGKNLDLLVGNNIICVPQHSVIFIDNYIYDFILGINGKPLQEYLEFLYSLNDSLGIDVTGTNYAGYAGDNDYLKSLQYAALCGVIGPTYQQFLEMETAEIS